MVKYVLEQQAISFGIDEQCDLVSDQLLLLSILCLVHVQLRNVFNFFGTEYVLHPIIQRKFHFSVVCKLPTL